MRRRLIWLGVCLGVALIVVAAPLVRSLVGGEPADGDVVNLGHVCGKNQPEVHVAPSTDHVMVNCLGGGLPSPELGPEVP